nr:hypothetical protein [Tanacetum cinerariifolium]
MLMIILKMILLHVKTGPGGLCNLLDLILLIQNRAKIQMLMQDKNKIGFLNLRKLQKALEEFDDLLRTTFDFLNIVKHPLKKDKLLKGTCKSCIELEYHLEQCYLAFFDKLDWTNPEGGRIPQDLSKPLPFLGKDYAQNCMRTRRSYFPITTNVTIPRRRRKQISNIVKPELRTMADNQVFDNRTMAQMLQASIEGYEDAIVVPPINANNFELKQTLINLVQSNQFTDKLDIRMNRFEKSLNDMKAFVTPTTPIKVVEELCVTCGANHSYNHCPLTRGGNEFPIFHDNIQQFQTVAVGNFVQGN